MRRVIWLRLWPPWWWAGWVRHDHSKVVAANLPVATTALLDCQRPLPRQRPADHGSVDIIDDQGAAIYGQVNRSDPTTVAEALLTATFTSNTTTDTSPQDAVNRSLIWYTTPEAAKIRSEEPPGRPGRNGPLGGASRRDLGGGRRQSRLGAPADTTVEAYRQFA